ncbi:polysaccharide deacetylase family protein [Microbaculum marinum]|uniref:Polysaccharide deacetylase family protein n=1 Tax=Microbaculum marinum TaxID=1764581 RepID=A0AAW9RVX2_9HYPH
MSPAEFESRLVSRLDGLAGDGQSIDFWWRDDDAVEPTADLDRLIAIAERHAVPVALAVIPEPARPELGQRLSDAPGGIVVFQHGFVHRNHAPKGEKAAELGAHRAADTVLGELRSGNDKLTELFGERFLPVLTPPWNRVGDEVAARRGEAGLTWLSTFARMHAGDDACVNTHVDVIDWKGSRGFAGFDKMSRVLDEELERRVAGDRSPIGLLTHHLAHDEGVWSFLDCFLSLAATHPAASWPALADLFGGEGA